jgi:hypothetical protein
VEDLMLATCLEAGEMLIDREQLLRLCDMEESGIVYLFFIFSISGQSTTALMSPLFAIFTLIILDTL